MQNVFAGSVLSAFLVDLGPKFLDLLGLQRHLRLEGVAFTVFTLLKLTFNAFADATRLDLGGLDLSSKGLDLLPAGPKRVVVLDARPP